MAISSLIRMQRGLSREDRLLVLRSLAAKLANCEWEMTGHEAGTELSENALSMVLLKLMAALAGCGGGEDLRELAMNFPELFHSGALLSPSPTSSPLPIEDWLAAEPVALSRVIEATFFLKDPSSRDLDA
eukprot:935746-Pleurochrysis_carterae.AAC.1